MTATVIGRAFHVSQTFEGGRLLNHLSKELAKAIASAALTGGLIPFYQMQARPKIISPPFTGIVIMSFIVRPPTPRPSPTDTLNLDFHFTVRSGVTVEVSKGIGPDEVKVTVLMNDVNYTPAPLPPKQDMTVHISDLPTDAQAAFGVFSAVAGSAQVLVRGIVTDRYTMPPAKSVHDNENVVTLLDVDHGIPGPVGSSVSVDNSQPYPIYGSLALQWIPQRAAITLRTLLHARGVKNVRALQPTGPISVRALLTQAEHCAM